MTAELESRLTRRHSSRLVLAIFRTAAAEWSALAQRFLRGESLSYGEEYDIADYISGQGIEDFSLFMLDHNHHLVYWLLDRYPPTLLATHPSNLSKPYVRKYLEPDSHTTEDALRAAFRREPTFVVEPTIVGRSWEYLDPAGVRFLQQELTNAYMLVGQIGSAKIWRLAQRRRLKLRENRASPANQQQQQPPDVAADAHLGRGRFLVVAQLQRNFGKFHAKRVELEQKLDHAGKTAL